MPRVKSIEDLIKKIRSYYPAADTELIKRSFWFSSEAHGIQTRKEGTPFISHPLEVAYILADLKMDTTTIASAILHDTVEDTPITVDDLKKRFGYDVAFLVDSLTKLSKIEFRSKEEEQAENFRRMFLSMAEDPRVIIIKLADRLHNMRTLKYLPAPKQKKIASETLEIYAPIANRLGIGWIKTELEDLGFLYYMPDMYKELVRKVASVREEQEGYIKHVVQIVKQKLRGQKLEANVVGRVKHYYGIYQKMLKQRIPFEQVHDVLGIRIVTDTKANCYAILGLIHSLWTPIPGKFKDYIGVPKSNMYQSLHTTVMGPLGERVEFQIRTEDMDRIAEEGIAAHWRYKEHGSVLGKEDKYIAWLRDLIQTQKEMPDAMEFVEAVKAEVTPDVIYVFTPNGDIKELPAGATPVDFAYNVHTEVGHHCVGAKVNGRIVPLRSKLHNGDTVDILTSPAHVPSRDWMNFVTTQKAKSRIKHWIKTEEHKRSLELGHKLLETELRKQGLSPSLIKSDEMNPVMETLGFKTVEDVLVAVGYGKLTPLQVVNRFLPEKVMEQAPSTRPSKVQKDHKGISIKGIDNILYHIGKCCYPVPGDTLVGLITRGRGVTIHRKGCGNLERMSADTARMIDVDWTSMGEATTHARLILDTVDRPGILATLSTTISALDVNINSIEAHSSHEQTSRITLTLEVRDRTQLESIMQKISQTEGVMAVRR